MSLAEWHKTCLPAWKFPLPKSFHYQSLRIDINFIKMSHSDEIVDEVVRKTASSNFQPLTNQSLIKKTASSQA